MTQPSPEYRELPTWSEPENRIMFRSFRNLLDPNDDCYISLRSDLPAIPGHRSQYFSSRNPLTRVRRSSSARTLRPSPPFNNIIPTQTLSTNNCFCSNPRLELAENSIPNFAMGHNRGCLNRSQLDGESLLYTGSENNLENIQSWNLMNGPNDIQLNRDTLNSSESNADVLCDLPEIFRNRLDIRGPSGASTAIQTMGVNRNLGNPPHIPSVIRPTFRGVSSNYTRSTNPSMIGVVPNRDLLSEVPLVRSLTNAVPVSSRPNDYDTDIAIPTSYQRGRLRPQPENLIQRIRPQSCALLCSTDNDTTPTLERSIQLTRHPNVTVQRDAATDISSSTSVSATSSLEDIQSASFRARATRHVPIENAVISPTTTPIPLDSEGTNEETVSEKEVSSEFGNDWRHGCSGSREIWRQLFISEKFADVWFNVGGNEIDNTVPHSRRSSPDPGAPGGPTCRKSRYKVPVQLEVEPTIRNSDPKDVHRYHDNNGTLLIDTSAEAVKASVDDGSGLGAVTEDVDDKLHERTNPINIANRAANRDDTSAPSSPHSLLSSSFPSATRQLSTVSEELSGSETIQSLSEINDVEIPVNIPTWKRTPRSTNFINRNKNGVDSAVQSDIAESPGIGRITRSSTMDSQLVRFGAHKLILATVSPVFEAMFYGPNSDHPNSQTLEIDIPDIHPKAFRTMLLYIYTDEIQLEDDLDTVFYVLYAAKKYMLPQLGKHCVEHLKDLITASNVCAILDRSLFFDEADLTRRCWHVMDVLASHVLSSPGLLQMEASNFKAFLKRDTLNCKESDVFAAVRRWAGAECHRLGLRDVISNRAQVAAEYLPLVRFPTMMLSDFAEIVANSGFLSLEVVRDLFVYITTKAHAKPGQRTSSKHMGRSAKGGDQALSVNTDDTRSSISQFSFVPRKGPRLWRCSRFSHTRKHTITSNPSNSHKHVVSFQVSNSIFLSGIGVYGPTQAGDRLTIRVELKVSTPANLKTPSATSVGTQFHGNLVNPRWCAVLPRASSLREFSGSDWAVPSSPRRRNRGHERLFHVSRDEVNRMSNDHDILDEQANKAISRLRTVATAKTQITSDGVAKTFDVHFPCPVKLIASQRYLISLHTVHKDQAESVSSSVTAMNSSSLYIGFFGRPEIHVRCSADDACQSQVPGNSASNSKLGRVRTNSGHDENTVLFRFWENFDSIDPGEVDRGFIPELLFYTAV